MPLKDEHHHEPTVQARQHHSISLGPHGRGVPRHQPEYSAQMTPLEIGMYILLAAFCFAIVVFVVSCIVYASKFKPPNLEGGVVLNGPSYPTPNNTSMGIVRENRKSKPTTLNAHDWVWLGRASIGTNNTQYVPSRTYNNNNNVDENQVRITTNPMSLNYSDPDDALNNAEPPRTIDTSTYSKRNSNSHKRDLPPAIPAHGVMPMRDLNDKYKPPVPPHRNIGVTAQIVSPPEPEARKHHKHRKATTCNLTSDIGLVNDLPHSAFTFDDALPSTATGVFQQEILQLAEKNKPKMNDDGKDECTRFVEFPKDASGNSSVTGKLS